MLKSGKLLMTHRDDHVAVALENITKGERLGGLET